jgi:uncharacterized Tic20 family protein
VVFCHLGGLLCFYLLHLIIPLAIWLTKKSESAFIDEQGREIVNFHISFAIYSITLTIFGAITFGLGMIITLPALLALVIIAVISIIQGAIKASNGEPFRYPLNLRLIK